MTLQTQIRKLAMYLSPYNLAGITFPRWWALLRDNQFAIDPPYWPRTALITLLSLLNSPLAWAERRWLAPASETPAPPPLIVLGFFRSGTTFVHGLFSLDDRFAYPTAFQTHYPDTFLMLNPLLRVLRRLQKPRRRLQDNLVYSWDSPDEEEVALALQTGLSPLLGRRFPRRQAHYERYRSFATATPAERRRWQAALAGFVHKVSLAGGGRPVVVKSPAHTARLRLLLEAFPQARFIHIHRNPYHVFQSARHLINLSQQARQFQSVPDMDVDELILEQYGETYRAYFAERELAPPGHLYELAYEDLAADPLAEMRRLYAGLGLPDFAAFEPVLSAYLARQGAYQKNRHTELPPELKIRLQQAGRRCFEEWNYSL